MFQENEERYTNQNLPLALQNEENSHRFIKGSPIFFFMAYVILMIFLITTIYIRTKSTQINSNDSINKQINESKNEGKSYSIKSDNQWLDIIIPPENQIKSNHVFKYPEILQNQNLSDNHFSFDRLEFQIENSRYIRLNPYDQSFSEPKVLVIGANTATGSKVVSKLKLQNIPVIPIKNYIDLDFSSPDAEDFFYNVTLTGAIVVHQPPLFRYASLDGYSYINEIIGNYTDGLMNFLYKRNIPVVYAVTRPYFQSNTNVDYCYGAKLVFLPNVIDSEEIYDTENILLRAARNCQLANHSKIVVFENSIIESVTSEDAADFLISQFNNFHSGRVTLVGSTNISLKEAIKMAVKENCKITYQKTSHKLKKVKESSNKYIIHGDVQSLIQSAFSDYTEQPIAKPYLSIVVTGRNDHFANGFENRSQFFIHQLAKSFKKVPTASFEFIFVDYATDYPKNPYLYEIFDWPPELINRTRIIIVPEAFHKETAARLYSSTPFLEYVAKNIGIWRSKGEFVLTMNPDSILSTNFIECISGRNLNEGFLYQTTRFCLDDEMLLSNTIEEVLKLNEEPWNQKKYNFKDYYDIGRKSFTFYRQAHNFESYLFRAGAGDFLLMSRKLWDAIGGFHEMKFNTHVDNLLNLKMFKLITGFPKMFLPYTIIHQEHPHINPVYGTIDSILNVFLQYLHHGRTNILPFESDRLDWGYKNITFKEIHI